MPSQTAAPTVGSTTAPAWTSPGSITAPDGSYATALLSGAGSQTGTLKGTGYGFTVPGGSAIVGILLGITRYATSAGFRDLSVGLTSGGVTLGSDKADTANDWDAGPPGVAKTYGGPTDTWGRTWTTAEVNASDFGFGLIANRPGAGSGSLGVDYAEITVYYADSPGVGLSGKPCVFATPVHPAQIYE